MCFSKPDIPKQKPLPPTPTIDDDAVKKRTRQEAVRLGQESGRASTIVSDLNASQVDSQKRVLLGV